MHGPFSSLLGVCLHTIPSMTCVLVMVPLLLVPHHPPPSPPRTHTSPQIPYARVRDSAQAGQLRPLRVRCDAGSRGLPQAVSLPGVGTVVPLQWLVAFFPQCSDVDCRLEVSQPGSPPPWPRADTTPPSMPTKRSWRTAFETGWTSRAGGALWGMH